MPNKTYTPTPKTIDEKAIEDLYPDVIEEIAINAHEVWAALRIAEGWSYGPKRNEDAKQHPCLVPYDELPDPEKEYDRQLAISVLGVITATGYTVKRVVPADTVLALREVDERIAEAAG